MSRCPRCPETILSTGAGAWREDVCATCNGRFLDGDTALRLFEEHLRLGRDMLLELTRDGPRRLICPGCGQKMTLTMARGIQVDLCGGCGGAWLDDGELQALTRGQVREVAADAVVAGVSADLIGVSADVIGVSADVLAEARAAFGTAGGLQLARAPASTAVATRFAVFCTNCDVELDLHETNWLINQYPWCATCAAPYVGFTSALVDFFGGLFGFLVGVGASGRRRGWGALFSRRGGLGSVTSMLGGGRDGMVSHSVDAMRIAPQDAEQRFASFFRPVR